MWRDADGDEHVAGPMARRGLALPLQPDLLARGDAGRNLDVELLAVRQPHAFFGALHGVFQRDRQRRIDVEVEPDAAGVEFKGSTAAATRSAAAEHAAEDLLKTAAAGAARTTAAGAKRVGLEAAG